jgi:arsenate reductase
MKIYHNPRCSKSRQTLELLRAHGQEPEVIEYLKTPPDLAELELICTRLGQEPQALIRFQEPLARELGLTRTDSRSRAQWLDLLHQYPQLLERPVVLTETAAVLGRPPENVRVLF